MRRLIKYWNNYTSDNATFSTCSTRYEILPVVMDNDAGLLDIIDSATQLDIPLTEDTYTAEIPKHGFRVHTITHAIATKETALTYNRETVPVYLGWITIMEPHWDGLPVKDTVAKELTSEDISGILNGQNYGIQDTGLMIDEETRLLIIDSWSYFHGLPLAGYSLDSLLKELEVDEDNVYFDDSVFRCGSCGNYDHNDNGYVYNFRIVNECELLGVNCGCYDTYNRDNYRDNVNDSDKSIELSTARDLESDGELEFIERFIGGMTDGRGGYFNGETTREGHPTEVLDELLENEPDGEFIFSHDESGQFQSYFSVWRVKQ